VLAKKTETDFTLPQNQPITQPVAQPKAGITTTDNVSAPAIVGGRETNTFGGLAANRYLIIICGVILLLLLLSDLKNVFEQKFASLDKKINNLVLLLISLGVIAVMYWL
jgi:hypothetical protein